VIADYDGDDVLVATYVTPGLDANLSVTRSGSTYYYLKDGLGSIRNLVDSNETTQNMYDYYAFGKALGDWTENVTNRYTYTAREWDQESGQYYYRARYYAGGGRFLSRDPELQGTNFYVYVSAQPVTSSDPTGLADDDVLKKPLSVWTQLSSPGTYAVVKGGVGGVPPQCAVHENSCSVLAVKINTSGTPHVDMQFPSEVAPWHKMPFDWNSRLGMHGGMNLQPTDTGYAWPWAAYRIEVEVEIVGNPWKCRFLQAARSTERISWSGGSGYAHHHRSKKDIQNHPYRGTSLGWDGPWTGKTEPSVSMGNMGVFNIGDQCCHFKVYWGDAPGVYGCGNAISPNKLDDPNYKFTKRTYLEAHARGSDGSQGKAVLDVPELTLRPPQP